MSDRARDPHVSVIVPARGRPEALAECLRALGELDYPSSRLEVIVVDDGSTVPLSIGPHRADGPAMTLIRQDNRGPAAARNAGAAAAAGDIVAFTDDDCRPRREWLRALVGGLTGASRVLVGGCTLNGLHDNMFASTSQDLVNFLYGEFFNGSQRTVALHPFITSNNMAASRAAFLSIGGFDETFRYSAGEDRELCERWVEEIGPLQLVPAAVVDHFHDMGMRRFLRQHFNYGRGAMHLFRRRGSRGRSFRGFEPLSFYWRMLRYPLRRGYPLRGVPIAALVAVAQVASIAGIAAEAAARQSHSRHAAAKSLRGADAA